MIQQHQKCLEHDQNERGKDPLEHSKGRADMADTSPPARPIFDPVDTSFDPTDVTARDDVESPSLSSSNALARFEFEPGRSKDGTKVLMVEWEDDANTRAVQGDWEISWEGKKTVLPARGSDAGSETGGEQQQPVNRLYFLLGPGVAVPSIVRLQKGSVLWRTNPLPAIFAPELGATAREAGKKGVLHTIWAKKRLQVLQREIEAEVEKNNIEGIGLEMAAAEKEWIEQNFGVSARPSTAINTSHPGQGAMASVGFGGSPSSPRSPGGGRLMDKLKGLKLGTSAQDLNGRPASTAEQHNPLSPETSDVAIGSFGSFAQLKGMPDPSSLAAKPAQRPIVAQRPVGGLDAGGMGSLNAFAASGDASTGMAPVGGAAKEDDLFALPMSPRSPEMETSPFSFSTQDIGQKVR